MSTEHQGRDEDSSGVGKVPLDVDDRLIIKWIESQEGPSQSRYARERLDSLLDQAAQPRHVSRDACIKLCYFVEQCRSSQSPLIQEVALSKEASLDLFNFYIEWNEKNQNRSMRQVLELIASLIALHPKEETASSIKESILFRLVSIITHQAAQPLVKPAFKSLEFFLSKRTLHPVKVIEIYEKIAIKSALYTHAKAETLARWDPLISDIFDWMTLPDISPAAGKCLVTLFGQMKRISGNDVVDHTLLWQRWIRSGLDKNPDALENVKNYLFPALFKLDRPGSLSFLEDLNKQRPISDLNARELNAHSLLQLAAIEAGKKAGLVEEPSTIQSHKSFKKSTNCVILQEEVIGSLLTCASNTVRSLAFSVLVSSPSSIRPFSSMALDFLQLHMGILYADTDAKFRNDVLSNTKQMIERIRGATAYLHRELEAPSLSHGSDVSLRSQTNQDLYDEISRLLQRHESFIEWYLEFLLGELIPTVSYQRHITALRAIALLLRSGIQNLSPALSSPPVSGNTPIWPYTINFFTPRSMRLLLDLLMDPFEDVRSSATAILKLTSSDDFAIGRATKDSEYYKPKLLRRKPVTQLHSTEPAIDHRVPASPTTSSQKTRAGRALGPLEDFITRAEELSKRTGRADYADGVARCYELLYSLLPSAESRFDLVKELLHDLDAKVQIAEQDLAQAVIDAPIHGTFSALNLVWESINLASDCQNNPSQNEESGREGWENLQELMLSACSRIWRQVKDVLCNDSPEGYLPLDIDELDSVDTKDVLSYSFRAVHESSNLMRTMAGKVTSTWEDGSAVISTEVFTGIGNLTFEQLSSLRHRGAFSTVSLTFARCCQLTQNQISVKLLDPHILSRWHRGAMRCIFEQASTTRRSAGIPALMTGILSANSDNPSFQDVMMELISLAKRPVVLSEKDETNLPQVHAMNCLKEIFKSSTLGKKSEGHIAECLQLAADSLNSEIWAIRNCGLLLLRSLIDCLFGTSESKAITEAGWDGRSTRLSYDRYPSLPGLLLKLLDTDTRSSATLDVPTIGAVESVFPALDIIRRAGPPPTYRDEISRLVSMHLGSQVWHVREIAARTICTLLLHPEWLSSVVALIQSAHQSVNHFHGVLIAVRLILERRLELDRLSATDGLLDIAAVLRISKTNDFPNGEHPEILAAFLEVSNTIAKILLSCSSGDAKTDGPSSIRSTIGYLFADSALEEFNQLMETYSKISTAGPASAALGNAIVRRAIYTTALLEDEGALQKILSSVATLNTDIILAAIDCVPVAWQNNPSAKSIFGVSRAYIGLLEVSKAPEVCSRICYDLAEALDKESGSIEASESDNNLSVHHLKSDFNDRVKELGSTVSIVQESPSLSNAQIRISGLILTSQFASQGHCKWPMESYRPQMKAWGQLLSTAGNASNDFDTRYAAAAALQSLYNNPHFVPNITADECMLPSLLALYDTLNDDDDEIRDLSALTVSRLLHKSLVPLAARAELVKYVCELYGRSPLFIWNIIFRMTGNDFQDLDTPLPQLEPIRAHFSKVLKEDDSLFVEEEQNLFVDEIREARLWSKAFEKMGENSWTAADIKNILAQPYAALAAWVLEGLVIMTDLLDKEDGPLGWTSKPAVFAACMRVLLSARAVIQLHERLLESGAASQEPQASMAGDIISALERFATLGHDKRVHESLLFEVQGKL